MELSDHRSYLHGPGFFHEDTFSWKLNTTVLKGQTQQELQREMQTYLEENDKEEKFLPLYCGTHAKQ